MLGNFDEITKQGFNVDDILATYNQNNDDDKTKTDVEIQFAADRNAKRKLNRQSTLGLFRSATNLQADQKLAQKELDRKDEKSALALPTSASTGKKEFNLIKPEENNFGDVSPKDFIEYLKFSSGVCGFTWFMIFCVFTAATQILPTFWLS